MGLKSLITQWVIFLLLESRDFKYIKSKINSELLPVVPKAVNSSLASFRFSFVSFHFLFDPLV